MQRRNFFLSLIGASSCASAVVASPVATDEGERVLSTGIKTMSSADFLTWAKANPDSVAEAIDNGLKDSSGRPITERVVLQLCGVLFAEGLKRSNAKRVVAVVQF